MECQDDECLVVTRFLDNIQQKFGFRQQHALANGLKRFDEKYVHPAEKEVEQSHDRACFRPIRIQDMTCEEWRRAQMVLACSTEKLDGEKKDRIAHNRKLTRECPGRECWNNY